MKQLIPPFKTDNPQSHSTSLLMKYPFNFVWKDSTKTLLSRYSEIHGVHLHSWFTEQLFMLQEPQNSQVTKITLYPLTPCQSPLKRDTISHKEYTSNRASDHESYWVLKNSFPRTQSAFIYLWDFLRIPQNALHN